MNKTNKTILSLLILFKVLFLKLSQNMNNVDVGCHKIYMNMCYPFALGGLLDSTVIKFGVLGSVSGNWEGKMVVEWLTVSPL